MGIPTFRPSWNGWLQKGLVGVTYMEGERLVHPRKKECRGFDLVMLFGIQLESEDEHRHPLTTRGIILVVMTEKGHVSVYRVWRNIRKT